ncbi:MAG: ankyrin repeat domain-containing protein [Chlamydiia bacterium]|nr:ankyrin repeat domain-containing protein [Chlamydiia bacterium]
MTTKTSAPLLSIASYDLRDKNVAQIRQAFQGAKRGKPPAIGLMPYSKKLDDLIHQYDRDIEKVNSQAVKISPQLRQRIQSHHAALVELVQEGRELGCFEKDSTPYKTSQKTQGVAHATRFSPSLEKAIQSKPLITTPPRHAPPEPTPAPIPKIEKADPALHEAVRSGNRALVIQLRLQGQSPWTPNAQGLTPLHEAVLYKDEDIYLDLLFPAWRGSDEKWQQFSAQQQKATSLIKSLSSVNPNTLSPVCLAAYEGDLGALEHFSNEELSTPDQSGRTALHYALLQGNEQVVTYFLKRLDPSSLTRLTRNGYSFLDYAILSKNARIYTLFTQWKLPSKLSQGPNSADTLLLYLHITGILDQQITAEAAKRDPLRLRDIELQTAVGNALWLGFSAFSYLRIFPEGLANWIGNPTCDSGWDIGCLAQKSAHSICSGLGWAVGEAWNIPFFATHQLFGIPRLFDQGMLPSALQSPLSWVMSTYNTIYTASLFVSRPVSSTLFLLSQYTGGMEIPMVPKFSTSTVILAACFAGASFFGGLSVPVLPIAWWQGFYTLYQYALPHVPESGQNYLPTIKSVDRAFAVFGNGYALLKVAGAAKVVFSQFQHYRSAHKNRKSDALISLGLSLFNLGAQIYVTYNALTLGALLNPPPASAPS